MAGDATTYERPNEPHVALTVFIPEAAAETLRAYCTTYGENLQAVVADAIELHVDQIEFHLGPASADRPAAPVKS